MEYLLINQQTKEEHLCDKVTIDGFDYYVNGEVPPSIGDKSVLEVEGFDPIVLTHFEECELSYEGKKVIATNNPSLDIPQVVDEVERTAHEYAKNEYPSSMYSVEIGMPHRGTAFRGFTDGYNKSQETHPFSQEDVREIFKIAQMQKNYGDYKPYTFEEAIQLWKSQQPKKVYYE